MVSFSPLITSLILFSTTLYSQGFIWNDEVEAHQIVAEFVDLDALNCEGTGDVAGGFDNLPCVPLAQNEDGSFMLEWDKNDPRWAMLNGLSQAQLEQIILKGLQEELGL